MSNIRGFLMLSKTFQFLFIFQNYNVGILVTSRCQWHDLLRL